MKQCLLFAKILFIVFVCVLVADAKKKKYDGDFEFIDEVRKCIHYFCHSFHVAGYEPWIQVASLSSCQVECCGYVLREKSIIFQWWNVGS